MTQSNPKSPAWLVAFAWLVVALPLGWGLYQSIMKTRPLFTGPVASSAPAKAPGK